MVGLYAYPQLHHTATRQTNAAAHTPKVLLHTSTQAYLQSLFDEYANRIHQQHDDSDAITSSFWLNNRTSDNRIRTRRYDHSPISQLLRTNYQHSHAILHRIAIGNTWLVNHIVEASFRMPLNFPPEKISFPFHNFW